MNIKTVAASLLFISSATAQINPDSQVMRVSLSQETILDAVNFMANCGAFGYGAEYNGNYWDLSVSGSPENTIELLTNPDRLVIHFEQGYFEHVPIGFFGIQLVGYELLDLDISLTPHIETVPGTPYYRLMVNSVEVINVDIDGTSGWAENRIDGSYDVGNVVLLDNLTFGSDELLNNYSPAQLSFTSDDAGILFQKLPDNPINRQVFVGATIENGEFGEALLSCESLGQGTYTLQRRSEDSWLNTDTYQAAPNDILVGSGEIYRFKYENGTDMLFSLPKSANYCLLDGEYHINNGEDLVNIARLVHNATIYIDENIVVNDPVSFSAAGTVSIQGPATITMSDDAILQSNASADIEIHGINFVRSNANSGTALHGSFTKVNDCSFSGFGTVYRMYSNQTVEISRTAPITCNTFLTGGSESLLVHDCGVDYSSALFGLLEISDQILVAGSEFTYSGSGQSNLPHVTLWLYGNTGVQNCTFNNCGAWDVDWNDSGLLTFNETDFIAPLGDLAPAFSINFSNAYPDVQVGFSDCKFQRIDSFDLSSFQNGNMLVSQCELTGLGAGHPGLVYPTGGTDYPSTTRFVDSSISNMSVFSRRALCNLDPDFEDEIKSCTFYAASQSSCHFDLDIDAKVRMEDAVMAIDIEMPFGHGDVGIRPYACCFTDAAWLGENWQGPEHQCFSVQDPGFVDAANGDLRLRWDSPCLDKAYGADIEFDLTKKDIGWKPQLERIQVGSSSGGTRDIVTVDHAAEFEIISDAVLDALAIPGGTTIRVNPGATLVVQSRVPLEVGESFDGPRVSILGTNVLNGTDRCAGISIIGTDAEAIPTTFRGVRFAYAPTDTEGGHHIEFSNLNFTDPLQPLDSLTTKFEKYDNAALVFTGCSGTVKNFTHHAAFGYPDEPDYLGLIGSSMEIDNCTFLPMASNQGAINSGRLSINGTNSDGQRNRLINCEVNGTSATLDRGWLNLTGTALDIRSTNFTNFNTELIRQINTAVYMGHGANNKLESVRSANPPMPLIHMYGGLVDLYCGYNKLLNWQYEQGHFITYGDNGQTNPCVMDWSSNAWGASCAQLTTNVATIQSHVPAYWAHVVSPLSSCLFVVNDCEDVITNPKLLLKNGQIAEGNNLPSVARAYYRELLWSLPLEVEASEASARMKAMGLKTTYALENYEGIRDDLFQAADSAIANGGQSVSVYAHEREVLNDCNGWLVEAYHGDRNQARLQLASMLAFELQQTTLNKTCVLTIQAAQKELESYPLNGGLSSMGPEQVAHRQAAQARAEYDLLFGSLEELGPIAQQMDLPTKFAITSCYPNPFNPNTHVRFDLPEEAAVTVKAYNVLGQQVANLLSGPLSAGRHEALFDGTRLASGIYIVQVETSANGVATQKVMLMK